MKLKLLASLVLVFGLAAEANQKFKINMDVHSVKSAVVSTNSQTFVKFNIKGFDSDRTVGAPELPVKSWLVVGTPETIKVRLNRATVETVSGKPYPVQEEACRCATDKVKTFQYNKNSYEQALEPVTVSYLGAYRGQPISKVDLRLAQYDAKANQVNFITNGEFDIAANDFEMPRTDLTDYLLVVPAKLAAGVEDFVAWKKSKGFNMNVVTVASPNNTLAAVQALIKTGYQSGADFVMIIGDENAIPMFRVRTSGSNQTPSDLSYYTMDGATDYVPDMFSSRIVASTVEQVKAQLAKSMEFEQGAYVNTTGLNKFIGIASNEGQNPSDDEYIKSIEAKYKETLNSEIVHFQQNDSSNSTPAKLNANLNGGAAWLTYLGHGSGTSWPSMGQAYSTSHVKQLDNKPSVKPIIIDVACQNGRLIESNLGSTFMRAESMNSNSPFGAVAYYGGSVNISWHPPAVMARGIAFEHMSKKFHYLGEALLAGQLYLAKNWTNKEDVIDNMEWYHLQGDPGLNISFGN